MVGENLCITISSSSVSISSGKPIFLYILFKFYTADNLDSLTYSSTILSFWLTSSFGRLLRVFFSLTSSFSSSSFFPRYLFLACLSSFLSPSALICLAVYFFNYLNNPYPSSPYAFSKFSLNPVTSSINSFI